MRKIKDRLMATVMYSSVLATILILLTIIAFVIGNGASKIDLDFLTQNTKNESFYVTFRAGESYNFNYTITENNGNNEVVIDSVLKNGELLANNEKKINLEEGVLIDNINKENFDNQTPEKIKMRVNELINPTTDIYAKVTFPQDGIRPLIITTIFAVIIALLISIPVGLFAAIYLIEYKIHPKLNKLIHFAIDSLSGIPSIVFGLFGFIFFCITLDFGISLLAAILTVTIMLLPIIIKTIEEALIAVPNELREASYGLGASKSQTIFKVIIPTAIPGILLAIILSIGRIIGESAIFIFTAGTTAQLPSLFGQSATLTVHAYAITREYNDIQTACAIGIVIIVIVLTLNLLTKLVSKKYQI